MALGDPALQAYPPLQVGRAQSSSRLLVESGCAGGPEDAGARQALLRAGQRGPDGRAQLGREGGGAGYGSGGLLHSGRADHRLLPHPHHPLAPREDRHRHHRVGLRRGAKERPVLREPVDAARHRETNDQGASRVRGVPHAGRHPLLRRQAGPADGAGLAGGEVGARRAGASWRGQDRTRNQLALPPPADQGESGGRPAQLPHVHAEQLPASHAPADRSARAGRLRYRRRRRTALSWGGESPHTRPRRRRWGGEWPPETQVQGEEKATSREVEKTAKGGQHDQSKAAPKPKLLSGKAVITRSKEMEPPDATKNGADTAQ